MSLNFHCDGLINASELNSSLCACSEPGNVSVRVRYSDFSVATESELFLDLVFGCEIQIIRAFS